MTVFEKIEAQQKGHEHTDQWMVGEQLKEICEAEPHCQEIVAADLENKDMSLEAAARKIKAWADEQHKKVKGNCVCVPPDVAETILRGFYGLPEKGQKSQAPENGQTPENTPVLDLASFF